METPRVLIVSSEIAPFAKTGGLADVAGSLAAALARLDVPVAAAMPLYRQVREEVPLEEVPLRLPIPAGSEIHDARVFAGSLPAGPVPTYFVRCDEFFDRPGLYGDASGDYADNARRFAFFSRAAVELAAALELRPTVIHANDWQTALVPVYWKLGADRAGRAATVLTIHNLGYQGIFPAEAFAETGLPPALFHWEELEFWGRVNFLKGGIVHADALTTVSPRYAREIQTEDLGFGLDGVLRSRADALVGILNGIDPDVWSPETDPKIPARYSRDDLGGKAACKRALQERVGLPVRDVPLLGMVSRLDPQKGLDILLPALEGILAEEDAACAVLGTGDPAYQDGLRALAARFPERMAAVLAFDEALAHLIEAGSDIFLMPSRFEPCGLNQFYSMRYGTIPIVRATGGLADSVRQLTQETLADGTGTGFVFARYEPEALAETVREALRWYRNREAWTRAVRAAMAKDWSWEASARRYLELYRSLLARLQPIHT